jgi:hypothetical protein
MVHFNSEIESEPAIGLNPSQDDIKNEPMLFNCDLEHALKLGGNITKAFLLNLSHQFTKSSDLVVDSRVHMLMPGWYPCIPGFHCDDVPRERSDGQPNHVNPSYRSEHCMMICGDASRTQFALGEFELEEPSIGEKIYKVWHPQIISKLSSLELKRFEVEQNTMVYFNNDSWHQGTPATKNGWRFFIRATINTDRKPTNELRRQTQVYLPNPMEGW